MMIILNRSEAHCWAADFMAPTIQAGSSSLVFKRQLMPHQGHPNRRGPNQQVIHHKDSHIYLHVECMLMELAASSIIQGHKSAALSHMGAQIQELLNGALQQSEPRVRFRGPQPRHSPIRGCLVTPCREEGRQARVPANLTAALITLSRISAQLKGASHTLQRSQSRWTFRGRCQETVLSGAA